MPLASAYGAVDSSSPLGPMTITRRDPLPDDVEIEILYCGVCHSDLHFARNEWGMSTYPLVPGHEILGRVSAVGSAVTKFVVGDTAAVGCLVDSCRTCASCREGLEQYCNAGGMVMTYGSPDAHLPGQMTHGGYSTLTFFTSRDLAEVGVLAGSEVIYLDRVEAKWPLGLRLEAGSRVPAHCTAIGKLQVQRHFVEDGLDGAVITTSEEEAEAALR